MELLVFSFLWVGSGDDEQAECHSACEIEHIIGAFYHTGRRFDSSDSFRIELVFSHVALVHIGLRLAKMSRKLNDLRKSLVIAWLG